MKNQGISEGVVHRAPTDFKEKLISKRKALDVWESLTPLARNEWICWISFVKKEETRKEHVKRAVRELTEGKRRPCCWLGCTHRTDKAISPSVHHILSKKRKSK